jgi:hypothetical protein
MSMKHWWKDTDGGKRVPLPLFPPQINTTWTNLDWNPDLCSDKSATNFLSYGMTLNAVVNNFEVRHPRCVSTKSNYKEYAYIVKHNYIWGGMVFTICKAQLRVSAPNVGHLQVVQWKTYQLVIHACVGVYRVQGLGGVSARSRKYGEVGGPWIWVG